MPRSGTNITTPRDAAGPWQENSSPRSARKGTPPVRLLWFAILARLRLHEEHDLRLTCGQHEATSPPDSRAKRWRLAQLAINHAINPAHLMPRRVATWQGRTYADGVADVNAEAAIGNHEKGAGGGAAIGKEPVAPHVLREWGTGMSR